MQQTNQSHPVRQRADSDAAREKLLSLLLAADRETRSTASRIVPRARSDEPVPLSFAQERLWFLDQMGLIGTAYNVTLAMRLYGNLWEGALQRSFDELLRRHESLRTRFGVHDGVPHQIVDRPTPIYVIRADLSSASDADARERALHALIQRAHMQRFDLCNGPLFRATLVTLAAQEHALILTTHHIVCDGWSIGLLLHEIGNLYAAYVRGADVSLAPLEVQYADYATWQRNALRGEVLEQQLSYWRQRLRGAPPELQLPVDRPRPALESFRGGTFRFQLGSNLERALQGLAQRHGVTFFMVALAAYQLLLWRWTGQDDIVVGSTVAGRNHPELERLIGCFVNSLALRTTMRAEQTFSELLRQVKVAALEAYEHQDLPFETIVKELRPARDLSRQPIFQVTLAFQNYPAADLQLPGLSWTWIEAESQTTHYDLTLHLREQVEGGLSATFLYSTDLFDASTIERLATHLRTMLNGIVDNPGRPLQLLPLMTSEERELMLVRWNETAVARRREEYVHELVSEQARKVPGGVAVIHEQCELTYGELERRSNQQAHYLRQLGVGPEVVVGLHFERSPDLVVGLLAILKAGGAYLPLDPSYPRERLALMLKSAHCPIVITKSALADRVAGHSARVVSLDVDCSAVERQPDDLPRVRLGPKNLAYVIYTSGSTGTPKGVMVEHAGLANYLHWALSTYAPESGGAIPISSSFSFDATATGLYCALLSGSAAVLLTEGQELEGLEHLLRQDRPWSLIKVSPAHLQALGPRLEGTNPSSTLGAIVVGGEPLPAATVRQWRSIWPRVRIFNQYGPTETVVSCTVHEVALDCEPSDPVPIGRPAWNVHVYVLDARMQPVPIGVPGELYVGGAQVARGYLGRAELTAERFVASPFGPAGARLYRTGDLVRYRADGKLEFLGRRDNQVKVRGYRIELGEIEATLLSHAAVAQAVVLAREDVPGEKKLVAYIAQRDRGDAALDDLRAFLKTALPEYMLPNVLVPLERFALTANGKIDRNALPVPDSSAYVSSTYEAPQDEIEDALAAIWKDLLHVERVGRCDNFFALGGHSLLGLQLTARVAARLGVRLSGVAVFQSPTIQQMATIVASLRNAEGASRNAGLPEVDEGVI